MNKYITTHKIYKVRYGKIRVLLAPRATDRLKPKARAAPKREAT